MNDEAAWQAHFDANPDDHFARQAFADWLDDRDDPRAAGMRAMGRLGLWPTSQEGPFVWWWARQQSREVAEGFVLPAEWFDRMAKTRCNTWSPGDVLDYREIKLGNHLASRAAAENAAALAWTRLTPEQQAEILSRVEVTA